jgi:hypothetical protein
MALKLSGPHLGKMDGRIGRPVLSFPSHLHIPRYSIFAFRREYSYRQGVHIS